MKRIVLVIVAVFSIASLVGVWRFKGITAGQSVTPGSGSSQEASLDGLKPEEHGAEVSPGGSPPAEAGAIGGGNPRTATVAQTESAYITNRAPGTGPGPTSPQNEERLEKFLEDVVSHDSAFADLNKLAETEAKDPEWSDPVEQMFRESIRRLGAKMTALQVAEPYCTQTVCRLLATGTFSSDAANADWQHLMNLVMNEPWFRQNFADTRSSMHGDSHGVVYVSYFVRKR